MRQLSPDCAARVEPGEHRQRSLASGEPSHYNGNRKNK